MRLRPLLVGMASYVPGSGYVYANWKKRFARTGTHSADYCYNVWLKHLVLLWQAGMRRIPYAIGELGPGSSLGVGLSALLCGAERYYAMDVMRYADIRENLRVFDELVRLFSERRGWCEGQRRGWPDITEYLDASAFPSHILTAETLSTMLSKERLDHIRWSLEHLDENPKDGLIKYAVPWTSDDMSAAQQVDLIVSQSVLEHVADLEGTYRALGLWVDNGGWMSHQIDFSSHGLTSEWNGHWRYPDWAWKLVVGKKPFLINRQPCSMHLRLIEKNGFSVVRQVTRSDPERSIDFSQLRGPWVELSSEDFSCRGLLLQARKV